MRIFQIACLIVLSTFGVACMAQTCDSPIVIDVSPTYLTGNTCSSTVQLPTLVDGAILGTQQIIHRVDIGPLGGSSTKVTLQPEADLDMELFICANVCSAMASCSIALDMNGPGEAETTQLPSQPGSYYLIVQGSAYYGPTCGSYSLSVVAPFND